MKIELICYLYNKKMVEDMGINTPDVLARFVVDTDQIESVREVIDDGEDTVSNENCMIYLKSGSSYLVKARYETLINLFR